MRTFIRLFLLAVTLMCAAVQAQVSVGQRLSDALPTEVGYRIPIPAGSWEVVGKKSETQPNNVTEHVVLKNTDESSETPYVVVRYASKFARAPWDDVCTIDKTAFWKDRYGTLPSQFLQKCQRVWLSYFSSQTLTGQWAWRGLRNAIETASEAMREEQMVLANYAVSKWYDNYVNIDVFLRSSATGVSPANIRTALQFGGHLPWTAYFKRWSADYVDALTSSVIEKRFMPVSAFSARDFFAEIAQAGGPASVPPAPQQDDKSPATSVALGTSTLSAVESATQAQPDPAEQRKESTKQLPSATAESVVLPSCPSDGTRHHCQGAVTFPSGTTYVGEWRDNAPWGQGILYRADGLPRLMGRWYDWRLIRSLGVATSRFPFTPNVAAVVPSSEFVKARPMSSAAQGSNPESVGKDGLYIVKEGDNLWNIGWLFSQDWRDIERWNQIGLNGKALEVGQQLSVAAPPAESQQGFAAEEQARRKIQQQQEPVTSKVQQELAERERPAQEAANRPCPAGADATAPCWKYPSNATLSVPPTSQTKISSDWRLPIASQQRFPEVHYTVDKYPHLSLKVPLEPSADVYAPKDGVVIYTGRFSSFSSGYAIRHADGLISVISAAPELWGAMPAKTGQRVVAKQKIGELKSLSATGKSLGSLIWEVYFAGDGQALSDGVLSASPFEQLSKLPEVNVMALLRVGVIRVEEVERASLRNPEFAISGTPLVALRDPTNSFSDWRGSYLLPEGIYEISMSSGLLLRDVERTQVTVKVGDVTRLRIQPNNNTPRGRFETVFLDGQGLRLGEQPSLVVATTPLAAPAAPPTPVASSTPQPDPSALAKEAADRARDQAERDRLAAEAQRTRAELEARLKSEEEARQKEKLAREQAQRLAQQEQAEREKQQAELQRRLAAEEQARRQMEQKAKQEQAERERQQAELQARLKAEEDARRREQQAREQSETRMKQEQAERERLAADNLRLRAELAKAQQALIPANLAYRRAFVVGIDTYKHIAKLVTAREDARAMAAALTAAGFSVSLHLDLGEKDLRAAWRKFVEQVEGGSEVAFFFAGHGVQLGGLNYLIPADVAGESERQLQDDSIPLQRILDDMTDRKAKLTLAVIDACRDNPFRVAGRNVGNAARGLAPTTPATGQMVIFSAGAGQRALDNLGPNDRVRNGVFTRVFVEEMKQRGVAIDKMARNTRTEVVRLARSIGHDQVPAVYDQTIGEFFLLK